MADDVVLTAEPRTEHGSRPAGRLRRSGKVPAVLYGLGTDTAELAVPARELNHILAGGANTLVTLKVDGDDALTLVRQIQRHPTRGDLLHVDFVRVRRDVAVSAEVALRMIGEPAGVLDGGVLEQLIFSLPIEAKPQDIPHEIEVDVSALVIGDQIRLEEVTLPPGVAATIEPDSLVVQVIAPRVVEEEVPEGEAVEGEEGAEGEAVEGEAGAEGAAEGGGESSEGDGE